MSEELPTITFGPEYGPKVQWENFVLLEALQSSQGSIGPSVRGIAVEALVDRVVVHACVSHRDERDLQELRDMVTDLLYSLEWLVEPTPTVDLELHVGETDGSWSGHHHRRLYLAARFGEE